MERETSGQTTPPPSGGVIRFWAQATDLGSSLGPAWAALCGLLASGAVPRQGDDWLRLALLLLLVDGGWGTLWDALSATNWALPIERWSSWDRNKATAKLPYTLPGTPGDRLSHSVGKLTTWWGMVFWPTCGHAVRQILITLPLTALVAVLLGPELLLLSMAALALMELGVIWEAGRGVLPAAWDGLVAVTLPWLAGQTTFGSVTLTSAGLATLSGLAWGHAWNVPSRGARAGVILSQLLSAAWLVLLHRPVAASFVALALVPQMALLPWIHLDLPLNRFVRHTRPWLMAAMMVAAFAL